MRDNNSRKKPKRAGSNASEIGVVRVFCNPGPDAEDRLRRLFALMVRYATQDGVASTSADPDLDRSEGETTTPEKRSSS